MKSNISNIVGKPNFSLLEKNSLKSHLDTYIHVIDLDGIRRATGVMWEKLRAAIRYRLEEILRRDIGSIGSFVALDDTRYAVRIPGKSAEVPFLLTIRAAYEHALGLFGKYDFKDLDISRLYPTDGDNFEVSPITREDIVSSAERAELHKLVVQSLNRRKYGTEQYGDEPYSAVGALSPARNGINIVHQFEPVWDAFHEVISTYICMPKEISATGHPTQRLQMSSLTIEERASLDLSSLFYGAEHMSMNIEKGDRFLLTIPVSYETLSLPRGRSAFTEACQGLLPAYRRYIMFLMDTIPSGVTQSRMSDLATVLRPFGRVAVAVSSGCRHYWSFDHIGLYGVALSLVGNTEASDQVRSDIVNSAAVGKHFKFGSAVFGITNPETLFLAQGADVRMMHGPAVGKAIATPQRMSRLSKENVIPHLENAGEEEWF